MKSRIAQCRERLRRNRLQLRRGARGGGGAITGSDFTREVNCRVADMKNAAGNFPMDGKLSRQGSSKMRAAARERRR